jgi:hypothetical protein
MGEDSETPTTTPGRIHLADRILSSAGGMVGACATLVGLVKLTELRHGLSDVDEFAGATAVAFVVSALLAHVALRVRKGSTLQSRLAVSADVLFLTAMVALAAIGVLFAYNLM